ncbi:hypothetical protein ACFYWU_37350 [Streptomyces chrestomyceticus]
MLALSAVCAGVGVLSLVVITVHGSRPVACDSERNLRERRRRYGAHDE